LYPRAGVYAVEVIRNQKVFNGLANVGYNPTFLPPQWNENQGKSLSVEVYILNFNEEIYGEEIRVNFKRRIRGEIRFNSASQLVQQIEKDIRWAKENAF
jgi:riboflavin kinase/FMN adenylyltransferase